MLGRSRKNSGREKEYEQKQVDCESNLVVFIGFICSPNSVCGCAVDNKGRRKMKYSILERDAI